MKKKYRLKKNQEYSKILKEAKPASTKNFLVYVIPAEERKFGIVVSKKIGNAVVRNFCKRRVRSILDSFVYLGNFHCIIMCKQSLKHEKYEDLKKEIKELFKKKGIVE